MYIKMSYNDKMVWESKFTKPLDAQLPHTQDFRTFSLQVMDGQNYSEVLYIDDNLAKGGVSQISLKTGRGLLFPYKWRRTALVPVTISFLNKRVL
jgi:hypothetical protein